VVVVFGEEGWMGSGMAEPIPVETWEPGKAETTEKEKTALAKKRTGTRGSPTTFRLPRGQRHPFRGSRRKRAKR
jgi:hypothetical protein